MDNKHALPEWRNPRLLADGRVDVEINHDTFGWIDYTAAADDSAALGRRLYAASVDSAAPVAAPNIEQVRSRRVAQMEAARKQAETAGVTVNGIRYAGDPSNRQALREAIEYADADSLTAFPSWKSSDDVFVANHPVQDVRDAYAAIGARRSQLIDREGQRVAEIQAATDVATVEGVTW